MDSIEKISFDTPTQNESSNVVTKDEFKSSSSMSRSKRFKRSLNTRRGRIIAGVLIALVLFFALLVVQGLALYKSVKATYAQALVAESAIKQQNIDLASTELTNTRTKLTDTQNKLHSMIYLKFIPIAWWYYNDADHLINAGFYGLDSASILIDSVKPYSDILGLKGKGSFVGGTAQQRIETAVKTMGKITPNIDKIAAKLSLAQEEIDKVNPNHYPPIGPGKKINSGLQSLKTMADQSVSLIESAKPLIKILPNILGEPTEKKYLIIFQNDKEIRPTGGFMTAYSFFRLDSGVVHVDGSDNIYNLDNTISGKSPAPDVIKKYLEVSQLNLRDSNLSPDFKVSMEDFKALYKKSSQYQKVDGIIAVDTQALVSAMNILGDMNVDGTNFSAKTDPRCDCPQAIYQLEVITDTPLQADFRYVDVNAVNAGRKGIIGDLMYAIMEKAFSSSPKQYWGPLFQAMLTQMSQKHIQFYMYDDKAQQGLEAFNAAGRILPFDGDYLHINEANLGGAKSNLFVSEAVTNDYNIANDGTVTKTVTIDYKNPYPPSDCNLERGNLCLNAVLRDWIRIYVPKGSQLVSAKGNEVKMKTYDQLDKTVFEGFLTVRPKGAAKYQLVYKLPFKLAQNSKLPLMIQKQPGTPAFSYTNTLDGKTLSTFNLSSDKTAQLSLR